MNREGLAIVTQVMVMAIVISVILLFLGIGVLVLIHVCIVGRAIRRGNADSAAERGSLGSTSMSADDVEKLPRFDFEAREKGSSPVICAVCLDNFEVGDNCRQLPLCKHNFHTQCVDLWLMKAPACPICRASAHYLWGGGGESSCFSESGRDFRESQTTEESGRFSESGVEAEIVEVQLEEIRDEPSETQASTLGGEVRLEGGSLHDVSV